MIKKLLLPFGIICFWIITEQHVLAQGISFGQKGAFLSNNISKMSLSWAGTYETSYSQLTLMFLGANTRLHYTPSKYLEFSLGAGYRRGQEKKSTYTRYFSSDDMEFNAGAALNLSALMRMNNRRVIVLGRCDLARTIAFTNLGYSPVIVQPDFRDFFTRQTLRYWTVSGGVEIKTALDRHYDFFVVTSYRAHLTTNQSGFDRDSDGRPNPYSDLNMVTQATHLEAGVQFSLNGRASVLRNPYQYSGRLSSSLMKRAQSLLETLEMHREQLSEEHRNAIDQYRGEVNNLNLPFRDRLRSAQKLMRYYKKWRYQIQQQISGTKL